MSIADKLTTIAENVPKVYEAGQKSMVDESKIIPKTVTGKRFVSVDDVSEISHDVEISVSSDCDVMVYGKNLCEPITDGITSNGITVTKNEDNTFTVNGTATALTQIILSKDISVINGLTYYLFDSETELVSFHWQCRKSGSTVKTLNPSTNNSVSATVDDTFNTIRCLLRIPSGTTLDNVVFKPTISFINDLKSETYIEPSEYTTKNGTAIVKSISPFMTVIADSDVDITMNYRKSYGIQTEYDRFWDVKQEYGNRTDYSYGFGMKFNRFNQYEFNPKYDMYPTNASYMFSTNYNTSPLIVDLVEYLDSLGVVLDFCNCTNFSMTFYACGVFTRIGVIDTRSATKVDRTFENWSNNSADVTIDELILKDDGSQTFDRTFSTNYALKSIKITGTIGNNFDIHWSPLTIESVLSVLTALTKDPTLASGKTATFKSSLRTAIEADPQCAEQIALAVTAGWTIAYA